MLLDFFFIWWRDISRHHLLFPTKQCRTGTGWQWSVVKNHKQTKCFFHHTGYHILRHSIRNWHPLNLCTHVTSSKKHISITGWRRSGYGTRINTPKKLADLLRVYVQAKAVVFCSLSQTMRPSDFSHIVAGLINADPLARQIHICSKCVLSMRGMCTGAPPLVV